MGVRIPPSAPHDGPVQPLRGDYDDDPGRFAANQAATAAYSRLGDVHTPVARRLVALSVGQVVDLGGGTGTLSVALAEHGVWTVVVDHSAHVVRAPAPAVRADVRALPFRAGAFDAAACLWMLYHVRSPEAVLREVARVVRPGGWFVAATSARTNDVELADVLDGWGSRTTFDAEDAGDIVGSVLTDVKVESWDAPIIELPDRAAVALYLRGRGLGAVEAEARAARFSTPMRVTKRGCLVWARVPG